MIRRTIYYFVWLLVVAVLILYSLNYKGGEEAMMAQVESEITAVSYQKPVLVKEIYVTPGQVVDSGDLLIEVERPDLKLDYERKIRDKQQTESNILDALTSFQNSKKILETKHKGNRSSLISEKEELLHQMRLAEETRHQMDNASGLSFNTTDSIRRKRILLIDEQIFNLDYEFEIEKQQLVNTFQNNTFIYQSELTIINKELDELEQEKMQLQRRAEKRSTVGNLFVQLNELVPPYQKLLSLYDINPNLIKAFVHERGVENLAIGAKVMVQSVNKDYKIEGQIIEIGSRITAYPAKINPLMNQNSYGQEIFISISNENDFLNGEKVYVYIIEDE